MGLEDDVFLYLKDTGDENDTYNAAFPVIPRYNSQESNLGALHLDNGPWIIQNMDTAQPTPKGVHSSLSSGLDSGLSTLPTSRVKVPLPSIRQRTAQACDKCRERKTKCSGHRPVCLRCTTRGLTCEYSARETRLRLPTRSRFHPGHIRPMMADPETIMQRVNYQPAAAARLGNNPPLVGICEPTPVYPGHSTMAFSSDRYLDWDGYQPQGTFEYGDPAVVSGYDARLGFGSSPFSLSQVDSTLIPVNYFIGDSASSLYGLDQ